MELSEVIYLDNNSTTVLDPKVLEAMMPFLTSSYANASSTHYLGKLVNQQVKGSREMLADILNCLPSELIFTSGSTESINLGLTGYAIQNRDKGQHIVSIKTEHKAVLDTLNYLESIGFEVTLLDVENDGTIDLANLSKALKRKTSLVSVMLSNNETGTINPIREICSIAHQNGSAVFCDATQGVGKIPVDFEELDIDLLSFSAHKFHGPKGVGVLFVRNTPGKRKSISPIQFGGGHENGLRSGTLNVPGIIGISKALELACSNMAKDIQNINSLRNTLESELLKIPSTFINGTLKSRIHNTTNICFSGLDANVFVEKCTRLAVSNGSACTAAIIEPSHVLKALGLSDTDANSSLRFSLSRFTTLDEINIAVGVLRESISKEILRYA